MEIGTPVRAPYTIEPLYDPVPGPARTDTPSTPEPVQPLPAPVREPERVPVAP